MFPNGTASGWVEMTSPTSGLQGFWIGGDFSTYTDGANAATPGADLIFPLIAGRTEINVTSPNRTAALPSRTTFRLIGANGQDLAMPIQRPIASRAAYQVQVSDLFPNVNLADAVYMRVSGIGIPLAGTEVVRGFLVKSESAVLNAVDATSATNSLNFVHAVSGSLGSGDYSTVVGVINLGSSAQTVTLTFNPDSTGSPIVVQRSLPAGGMIRENARSLFSLSSEYQSGWIQVSGSSALTGFVAYADLLSGGLAAVPAQTQPQTNMLFDQIAGTQTWYTGLGLLNASTVDATVEVFAMTPGGTLIGGAANVVTARFTLAAGRKIAKLLNEIIPGTASHNAGYVYVRSLNDVPLYGMELFGNDVLPILSNVAASGVLTDVRYTPPGPAEPLTLTAILPARASRNSTVRLNGNGFAYPASGNAVVFTTTSGPVEVAPMTSSLTALTVPVPRTAITGPIFVRTGGRDSPPLILEVTAGPATMLQNAVTVTEGETIDKVDIYVPPAAAVLKLFAIGGLDVGATQTRYGVTPVELLRGQTKSVLIVGLGLSRSSQSTVTVSGNYVRVAPDISVENGLLVTVTVDNAAEIGPRTVFVTNGNLDTSSIPGGVYIR